MVLRTFGDKGFDAGIAGHFTVRDPEDPTCFWVNPMDLHLSLITENDLVLVDKNGYILEGKRPANTGAFCVHAFIHEARPDIICSIHTHLTYSKILSINGDIIHPRHKIVVISIMIWRYMIFMMVFREKNVQVKK